LNPIARVTTLTSETNLIMTDLLPIPFVGLLGLGTAELGIIVGIFGLGVGLVFGLFGMYFHHRRQELWHETARIALEKGQPLPALPNDEPSPVDRERAETKNDFRSGFVLIAVGIGLYIFLTGFLGISLGRVGAIPGLIGVALLLYAVLNSIFGRKKSGPDNRPPQS
jgi:hypothetical protein